MQARPDQMGKLQKGTPITLDDDTVAVVSYAFWNTPDAEALTFVVENDGSLWAIKEYDIGCTDEGFVASTENLMVL